LPVVQAMLATATGTAVGTPAARRSLLRFFAATFEGLPNRQRNATMERSDNRQKPGARPHRWIARHDLNLLTPELHDLSDVARPRGHVKPLRRIAAVATILAIFALAAETFVSTAPTQFVSKAGAP
jgi:hypothetical protein